MSLSKLPIKLSMKYLIMLYSDPIRTKSLSSCVIASLGNVVSQCIAGALYSKSFDFDNLRAHALFGLIFGGTVPHYFFILLDELVARRSKHGVIIKLLIERLIYTPLYQILSFYALARFQSKSHDEAVQYTKKLFFTTLKANWKFLTILQFINLKFVHPMFRVLILNFIWVFWSF